MSGTIVLQIFGHLVDVSRWADTLAVSIYRFQLISAYVVGSACLPVYLAGQISTRIGSFTTKVVMITYLSLVALCFFVAFIVILATEDALASWNLLYIPTWLVFFWLIFLRYKFVERYQISESGVVTFLISFFCSPCSLCQMARHQYGYTRVLDGDGLLKPHPHALPLPLLCPCLSVPVSLSSANH
jgi:Cys-rich protein (TIGR01571 family)